jgi:sugar lactone lactonase YvrE
MTKTALIMVVGVCLAMATVMLPRSAGAAAPASLTGVVHSGGTAAARPLAGDKGTLYEATAASPLALDQATTDPAGTFVVDAPTSESEGVFYVTADVGRGVELVAVLGKRLPPSSTINELTTVAAGYSMAQFTGADGISGDDFALRIAAGMNDNIVETSTGTSSQVLLSSPNADETNSLRSTRSLANLLAAGVVDRGVTASFLALTKPLTGSPPPSTFKALADLARNPGQNVQQLYRLSQRAAAYAPALEGQPDAWTVVVKVNDSGSDEQKKLIGGPGNLAFDARGYAWVTNNVVQGTTGSSTYVVVLRPDGRPAEGTNGTPSSPLGGGGILGTGFGVTIGGDDSAWFGNFGWGGVNPVPGVDGSVSQFSSAGAPLSGPNGYLGEPDRVQGMATDADGNVWMASFGDNSVYVFPGGDPSKAVRYPEPPGSQPFDVAIAPDGSAWVSNGFLGTFPATVAKFVFEHGKLERRFSRSFGRAALKGITVDSKGNAWVASLGDDAVYGLRPDGSLIGSFDGGGIYGPWDVTVDGDDNLWVANFGPIAANNTLAAGRLSELCGTNRAACPPGKKLGDPISPATGFTVPSAGSQVLLHNGEPLYGRDRPPSYIPMMRQTASVIDSAGNVWTINNYKPNFDVDATENPGGDGILIFVGLAPPPQTT